MAPDLLKLCRGDVGAVVSRDRGPELIATSLVDGTKAVGINGLGLVHDLGVESEPAKRLGRLAWRMGAGLGQQNLVLGSARRRGKRSGSHMRAAIVAHG